MSAVGLWGFVSRVAALVQCMLQLLHRRFVGSPMEGDKIILHLTMAVGEISFLFRFRTDLKLDFIEFKRNFFGKTKRYDYSKFTARIK